MVELKRYNCTRNAQYSMVGDPGHGHISNRESYLVLAPGPMDAAMQMFMSYPEEAFEGFTIQPDGDNQVKGWTIASGLRVIGAPDSVGSRGVPFGVRMEAPKRDRDALVEGLRKTLTDPVGDDTRVTMALFHHDQVYGLLFRSDHDLSEDEVMGKAKGRFGSGASGQVEIVGHWSPDEIERVENRR